MKIAVIGRGNVGGTLARAWKEKGHEVRFGVRAPAAGAPGEGAVGEVVDWGEVVVLATPWGAVSEVLGSRADWAGKILMDCTNPLLPNLSGLEVGTTDSGGERVAALASGARVVKVFNTTGSGNMANPVYAGTPLTMFYCGDDAEAKAAAARLAADAGFDAVDAGPLRQARLLEPLALLWITLALRQGLGTNIALQLVRR